MQCAALTFSQAVACLPAASHYTALLVPAMLAALTCQTCVEWPQFVTVTVCCLMHVVYTLVTTDSRPVAGTSIYTLRKCG